MMRTRTARATGRASFSVDDEHIDRRTGPGGETRPALDDCNRRQCQTTAPDDRARRPRQTTASGGQSGGPSAQSLRTTSSKTGGSMMKLAGSLEARSHAA